MSDNMIALPDGRKVVLPEEFRAVAALAVATEGEIGGVRQLVINDHRALHSSLKVRRDHSTWIRGRAADCRLVEGRDFEVFPEMGENPKGGRPAKVYRLTVNAAKEVAMMEGNEIGKIVRRFYIWLENAVMGFTDVAPAVAHDDSALRRIDGISRMVSHKVTGTEKMVKLIADSVERQDQRIEHLETAVIALAQATKDLMLLADSRGNAAVDRVSVRQLLDEAGALPKGRNSLNRRIGNALRDLALTRQPPVPLRRCLHSAVWLFPIEFAHDFMKATGNAWVQDHNAKVAGQGVLRFPNRHKKPDDDDKRPGA